MTQLLVLHNSLNLTNSASRAMTQAYVDRFRAGHPEAKVIERDLASNPLPPMSSALLPYYAGQADLADAEITALSRALIAELEASEIIVLGLPMYNFTVPASLKTWMDYVVCVGKTFRYTEAGPVGLLTPGKQVMAFVASGGVYSEGPAAAMDFMIPYLKTVLSLIGVSNVQVVRAEGSAFGDADVIRADAASRAATLAT